MKFKEFKGAKTLSLASLLSIQNLTLANELKNQDFIYISCFEDEILGGKNLIRCEIGSISYVLALLCKYCLDFSKFESDVKEYFDELDEGFLSGECNIGEEEFEDLAIFMKDCENMIIDSTFFSHPDSKMIFECLNLLNLNTIVADSKIKEIKTYGNLDELKELESFDGSVVFGLVGDSRELVGSSSFAIAAKIKDGDEVKIKANGLDIERKFRLNSSMKGTVAIFKHSQINGYNFKVAKISKLG